MAKPQEKLAQSLKVLKDLQQKERIVLRTTDLSRTHRERLLANGFIREVIKGWYIPTRPDEGAGESTGWYSSFWEFCTAYLNHRFGAAWCLSPEQSLNLHSGNKTIPKQVLIRAPKASNKVTLLLYETAVLDVRATLPEAKNIEILGGMRVFSIPAALVACSPTYFHQFPVEARSVLTSIKEPSALLEILLEGGHSTIAGRLAGAFHSIGSVKIAEDIVAIMRSVGYDVREENPFAKTLPEFPLRKETSPSVTRLCLMWQQMKPLVIENFPKGESKSSLLMETLKNVEDAYVKDAYNSLSIEGYRVSPELIERVSKGDWNPDKNERDGELRNVLAARGYWQAFQAVKESLKKVLRGQNAGLVAENDHGTWYRELFSPSVVTGILRLSQLAGYRGDQVFIRRSRHVPPPRETVRELMPVFFNLLKEETNPEVRVVLGHFFFVYIHPYMDGNGRMARFLMNVMLVAGGWPWAIISMENRMTYFEALEEASVHQNIVPFAQFIGKCVTTPVENGFDPNDRKRASCEKEEV
ncbi:MAG: Fic family protein [Alphaproteobacteria bacterium]|nr:Fic family protein [Alphaproteobacteria bacterium]